MAITWFKMFNDLVLLANVSSLMIIVHNYGKMDNQQWYCGNLCPLLFSPLSLPRGESSESLSTQHVCTKAFFTHHPPKTNSGVNDSLILGNILKSK